MSTTRPSPRMEAPLIRSVATVWSSSALITSSSSPSRLSTIIPSFRSPMEITSTKIFSDPPVLVLAGRAPQADQGQDAIAQLQDFVVLHLVHVGFPGARNFRHCVQGNGIQPLLHPEQQGLDDGQRERQLQAEGRALSHPGLNFDRALQAVQHGLHHVQADAAAGDFGDLVRGAEPGPEDQRKNFSFAQPVRLFRGEETLLQGLGFDFVARRCRRRRR